MWGCCDDTSSDDDEQRAHAVVAPALPSGPTELDELSVALTSRFALDIFAIMQQDYPPADQESSVCSGSLDLSGLDAHPELVGPQAPGASTARSVPSVPLHGCPPW